MKGYESNELEDYSTLHRHTLK